MREGWVTVCPHEEMMVKVEPEEHLSTATDEKKPQISNSVMRGIAEGQEVEVSVEVRVGTIYEGMA